MKSLIIPPQSEHPFSNPWRDMDRNPCPLLLRFSGDCWTSFHRSTVTSKSWFLGTFHRLLYRDIQETNKNLTVGWGCRESFKAKSTGCSSKWPGFNSQHSAPITRLSWASDLLTVSGTVRTCYYTKQALRWDIKMVTVEGSTSLHMLGGLETPGKRRITSKQKFSSQVCQVRASPQFLLIYLSRRSFRKLMLSLDIYNRLKNSKKNPTNILKWKPVKNTTENPLTLHSSLPLTGSDVSCLLWG